MDESEVVHSTFVSIMDSCARFQNRQANNENGLLTMLWDGSWVVLVLCFSVFVCHSFHKIDNTIQTMLITGIIFCLYLV